MSDATEAIEGMRFPELAAALQKDEALSNEARVKLVDLMNAYSPSHNVSYLKTVQTFVGKSLMARAVDRVVKDRFNSKDIVFVDSDDDEPEPPPKKPKPAKVDHLKTFETHERVLAHYMQLKAGFTMETDTERCLQFVVPKRQKPNELKYFRARLAKHLEAVGFVRLEDEDEKAVEAMEFPNLTIPEHLLNAWVRSTMDADGNDASLDPHTLKPPAKPIDVAPLHDVPLF